MYLNVSVKEWSSGGRKWKTTSSYRENINVKVYYGKRCWTLIENSLQTRSLSLILFLFFFSLPAHIQSTI